MIVQDAVLDCRSLAEFSQGHCRSACCIPAAELAGRMHELPKTSVPLQLYGTSADLLTASEFLAAKGYQVTQQNLWTPALEIALKVSQQWESGVQSQRLWEPALLLVRFVHEFMPQFKLQPGQGLDIGCGAGRDAVYLAMHGWQMTGIDYLPGALQRARQLATSQQVALNTLAVDLETGKDPFTAFTTGQFELICVARYLHRPLFPWIKRILKPGGMLIYQTFMQGAEQFGSPRNPNFLLKPNELAQIFAGSEIWLDDVEYLDDGRPVSTFICRYE
ncbi:methyltransferase domain-containing protein [Thiothrix unzii]|uniref:methyltransferase domain-containing protein n=1 Tax=Thiothrix unzii TaxID=111769 RepID=UPI002A359F42|nr:methyltransferase domain-containing protein [Thiothrix unzii]MDX9990043.1 methyltransferase domain-containing protein [Thiothrix unzii]